MDLLDRLIGFCSDAGYDEVKKGSIIIVKEDDILRITLDKNGTEDQVIINET